MIFKLYHLYLNLQSCIYQFNLIVIVYSNHSEKLFMHPLLGIWSSLKTRFDEITTLYSYYNV